MTLSTILFFLILTISTILLFFHKKIKIRKRYQNHFQTCKVGPMPPRLNKRGGVQGWGDTANEDIMLIKIIVYLDVNK